MLARLWDLLLGGLQKGLTVERSMVLWKFIIETGNKTVARAGISFTPF